MSLHIKQKLPIVVTALQTFIFLRSERKCYRIEDYLKPTCIRHMIDMTKATLHSAELWVAIR